MNKKLNINQLENKTVNLTVENIELKQRAQLITRHVNPTNKPYNP